MFANPCEEYEVNPIVLAQLDKIFSLYADHEQNASTSTVRLSGSSGANPFACIAAGIASLWGPAHGGANEACLRMLEEIGSVDNIEEYVAKSERQRWPIPFDGLRSPRLQELRSTCNSNARSVSRNSKRAKHPRSTTWRSNGTWAYRFLSDEYFVSKKLYPNVDFYSGIILKAIGIPVSMFTVIFAMSRTISWIAHWNEEMHSDPTNRIGRPRQLYTLVKSNVTLKHFTNVNNCD